MMLSCSTETNIFQFMLFLHRAMRARVLFMYYLYKPEELSIYSLWRLRTLLFSSIGHLYIVLIFIIEPSGVVYIFRNPGQTEKFKLLFFFLRRKAYNVLFFFFYHFSLFLYKILLVTYLTWIRIMQYKVNCGM